jgi:hypothetical protein
MSGPRKLVLIVSVLFVGSFQACGRSADVPSDAGCRFATRAEASATLGKPTMAGVSEGPDRCFFAADDTKSSRATEYVEVTVMSHENQESADSYFRLFNSLGRYPSPLSGLGDKASFVKNPDGGSLLVIKGKLSVLVSVTTKDLERNTEPGLKILAAAVLSKN